MVQLNYNWAGLVLDDYGHIDVQLDNARHMAPPLCKLTGTMYCRWTLQERTDKLKLQ